MAGHGLMWSNIYQPEKPTVKRRVNWKRLGALFAPYWRQQATVLACIVVASALGLVPGFVVAHLIDVAIPRRNLGAARESTSRRSWFRRCLPPASASCRATSTRSSAKASCATFARRLVGHLHRMPLQFFSGTKTGEIMNRVSNDVNNVDNVVTGTLTSIITNVVLIGDDGGRDVRLELAPRADLGRDRAADGAAARAGRAADVSDSQEDAREPRRDRVDHPGDALDLRHHARQVVRARRRSSAPASIKPVRG